MINIHQESLDFIIDSVRAYGWDSISVEIDPYNASTSGCVNIPKDKYLRLIVRNRSGLLMFGGYFAGWEDYSAERIASVMATAYGHASAVA